MKFRMLLLYVLIVPLCACTNLRDTFTGVEKKTEESVLAQLKPRLNANRDIDFSALCSTRPQFKLFLEYCQASTWLALQSLVESNNWQHRKSLISAIDDSSGSTIAQKIYKVMLSQGSDTPYQDRLRAQSLIKDVVNNKKVEMSDAMKAILSNIHGRSEKILENKSELVLLENKLLEAAKQLELSNVELEALRSEKASLETKIGQLLDIEQALNDNRKEDAQ